MSTDDIDELAALAKQIDLPAPDEPRVELMRASLLRAAAEDRHEPRARWPFVAGGFTAGAIAAAATALVVLHASHPVAVEQRAQIEASTAADFDRTITHDANGTDEVVRLHSGRISLAVEALPSGDHVRVVVRDGEIEGAGLYEVAVVDDAVREVSVKRGTARVRLIGQQEVFLATGQVWKAPIVMGDLKPTQIANVDPAASGHIDSPATGHTDSPANFDSSAAGGHSAATGRIDSSANGHFANGTDVAAPARGTNTVRSGSDMPAHDGSATAPIVRSSSIPHDGSDAHASSPDMPAVPELHTMADASPGETPPNAISQIAKAEKKPVTALEQHFAAGWSLLRAGKSAEAARELAAAADAGGDDPLAGDARYFEAIALTRAGRKTEAEHALVAFMDRSPQAVRRGRAAVMLGRLIAERGDKATARTWFESAIHDPDPDVVAAANAELAHLK